MLSAKVLFASAIAGLTLLLAATTAVAKPASVTIDNREPELVKSDDGGWTVTLGFTNLTDRSPSLELIESTTPDAGCKLTGAPPALDPATHQQVVVTIPARCEVPDDGFEFSVVARDGKKPIARFPDLLAGPNPDAEDAPAPEWNQLLAFPIALGALLALAGIVLLFVRGRPANIALKQLDDTWSFKDSWVTNVTIAGGLLTGIFGSTAVVQEAIGENADASIALATVGALLAVAMVAAGPIVLITLKSWHDGTNTVHGLLFGSAVTLAGAAGELWIIYRTGNTLDLGGAEDWVGWAALLAGLLLLTYAVSTIVVLLRVIAPKVDKRGKARKLVGEALGQAAPTDADALAATTDRYAGAITDALAAEPRQLPRRGAVL